MLTGITALCYHSWRGLTILTPITKWIDERLRLVFNRAPMSINPLPYKRGSLLFAPMEGVTDEGYRRTILALYPEWDQLSTDFLRVPTVGRPHEKMVLEHFGHRAYADEKVRRKTTYQILTSERAETEVMGQLIESLGFGHLDLNLGCPSKKVNSHRGGSWLLSDHQALIKVIQKVRRNFNHTFTVKIRLGYESSDNFEERLRIFEGEGVDGIIIHGRTRYQLYQGVADWSYIKRAVEISKVPIIGNGDVWNIADVDRMFNECGVYAVMIGRGALKTPWLASYYRSGSRHLYENEEYVIQDRAPQIQLYFETLLREFRREGREDANILKRFKSFSRYLFEDFENPEALRSRFLRSETLAQFRDHLFDL